MDLSSPNSKLKIGPTLQGSFAATEPNYIRTQDKPRPYLTADINEATSAVERNFLRNLVGRVGHKRRPSVVAGM